MRATTILTILLLLSAPSLLMLIQRHEESLPSAYETPNHNPEVAALQAWAEALERRQRPEQLQSTSASTTPLSTTQPVLQPARPPPSSPPNTPAGLFSTSSSSSSSSPSSSTTGDFLQYVHLYIATSFVARKRETPGNRHGTYFSQRAMPQHALVADAYPHLTFVAGAGGYRSGVDAGGDMPLCDDTHPSARRQEDVFICHGGVRVILAPCGDSMWGTDGCCKFDAALRHFARYRDTTARWLIYSDDDRFHHPSGRYSVAGWATRRTSS